MFDVDGMNRCNMPHVSRETYPRAKEGYKLEYVEVVLHFFCFESLIHLLRVTKLKSLPF